MYVCERIKMIKETCMFLQTTWYLELIPEVPYH